MPTTDDIKALRSKLENVTEERFSEIMKQAKFRTPADRKLIKGRQRKSLQRTDRCNFERYLDLTGLTVDDVREEMTEIICREAHTDQGQFGSVQDAAELESSDSALSKDVTSIRQHTAVIATKTPIWRDLRFIISAAIALASLFAGYQCISTNDATPEPAATTQPAEP